MHLDIIIKCHNGEGRAEKCNQADQDSFYPDHSHRRFLGILFDDKVTAAEMNQIRLRIFSGYNFKYLQCSENNPLIFVFADIFSLERIYFQGIYLTLQGLIPTQYGCDIADNNLITFHFGTVIKKEIYIFDGVKSFLKIKCKNLSKLLFSNLKILYKNRIRKKI